MTANDRLGVSFDDPQATLALWDYRRQVADLYHEVRALDPEEGWHHWREGRRHLFATHSQSAIPSDRRDLFEDLPYFPYDPSRRVVATMRPVEASSIQLPHSGDGTTPARAFGRLEFDLAGDGHTLTAYWLEEYGGGVFVPFRDETNGSATYGGGRYLLDTAKGADLGDDGDAVVLDFNFAYHPSCFHDPQWSCPLSPAANRLDLAIEAGERI